MKVLRRDPFTGKENVMELEITHEELKRWRGGELIQNVWPQLSADEREFIKTGIMPESWDKHIATDDKKNAKESYTQHSDFNFVNTPTKE